MSATENVIARLYKIHPPDAWEHDIVDIPVEHGLVPHTYNIARVAIYPTEFIRDAIRMQLVVTTVPEQYAEQEPERPSAVVRLETFLMPIPIAECNDGSEKDQDLMRGNVRHFLNQGQNWERILHDHLATCRGELAVLLGEGTVSEPRRRLLDIERIWRDIRNLLARKVTPLEREMANIRSHWMVEAFFRDGVVPHFEESYKNAYETALQDNAAKAVRLGTRIADGHLSAGQVAYEKLSILKEQAP